MIASRFSVFFLAFAFAATLVGCADIVKLPAPALPTQAVEQTVDEQEETQVNKETVQSFLSAVSSNDAETAGALMSDYIQHNPFIPDGPDAILSLFPVLAENNTQVTPIRLIQDGIMWLPITSGRMPPPLVPKKW